VSGDGREPGGRRPAGDRIDAPSLVDMSAAALRRLILSGEYRPGDRLIEERLTERLGISRPPLREAMRILHFVRRRVLCVFVLPFVFPARGRGRVSRGERAGRPGCGG
jgi:hypothetical protein